MKKLTGLDWFCMILTIIGGLNWGLVGLFSFDLVAKILGPMSSFSRVVYVLVGCASVYFLLSIPNYARKEEEKDQ